MSRPDTHFKSRFERLQYIQSLDPVTEHQQICHLTAGYELSWDVTRALELALLRTFCVPSVSKLLDRTGEFHHHTQKRYDDTGLIVSEMFKQGYDSPRGSAFLERMNQIHGHYAIGNDDFLYVLSTFIYEPVRWCDRFAWRPFCEQERLATFYFWRAVGERMGIQNIPQTYDAFEQFNRNYEAEYFDYALVNRKVANSTKRLFLSWFPRIVHPLGELAIPALLDEPMRQALGWQAAPAGVVRAVEWGLRARSWMVRGLPPRRSPDFFADQRQRSYPKGYELEDIGPPKMLKDLRSKR